VEPDRGNGHRTMNPSQWGENPPFSGAAPTSTERVRPCFVYPGDFPEHLHTPTRLVTILPYLGPVKKIYLYIVYHRLNREDGYWSYFFPRGFSCLTD